MDFIWINEKTQHVHSYEQVNITHTHVKLQIDTQQETQRTQMKQIQ